MIISQENNEPSLKPMMTENFSSRKVKLLNQSSSNTSVPNQSDDSSHQSPIDRRARSSSVSSASRYTLYGYRWLELALYALCTAINQVCWISLQPIAGAINNGYGFGSVMISSIGVTFMAIYIVVNFPANYAMDKLGLRIGILIGATLTALGMGIKVLINESFYYVMVGQFIAAAG